jgi:hypothetical protein
MPGEHYTIKINRREGIVEITGPDKDWIAAQLDRLSVVYKQDVQEAPGLLTNDAAGSGEESATPTSALEEAKKPTRRRRSGARGAARVSKPSEIEDQLTPDVMRRMHTYFDERPKATKNHNQRSAVIATFLSDELDIKGIGANDLIAVYRAMGWSPPKNASAVLRNSIDRFGYFGGLRDGKAYLTPTGEHFGRHGSKESDDKK